MAFFILHTDVLPETKNFTFQKFNWNLHISFPQLFIAVVVLVNFNLGELLTPICHLQSYLKKKKKKKSLKINFMWQGKVVIHWDRMALTVHCSAIKAFPKSLILPNSNLDSLQNVMMSCQLIKRWNKKYKVLISCLLVSHKACNQNLCMQCWFEMHPTMRD